MESELKHTTPQLMKFMRLQRRLGETKRSTVGLLELLWIETIKQCPEGDIGRFANEEIAILLDWQGDGDELVDALVETGWLDRHESHRLVVHDWHDHAPNFLRGNLTRAGKSFASQYGTQSTVLESGTQSTVLRTRVARNLTKPVLPNQVKPNHIDVDVDVDVDANVEKVFLTESETKSLANRIAEAVPPVTIMDRELVLKLVELVYGSNRVPEDDLATAIETTKRKSPNNPRAYLHGVLKRRLDERGENFNALLKHTPWRKELLNGNPS